MNYYITGDTHGSFTRVALFCSKANTQKEDVLVILGDAGINYWGNEKDHNFKKMLSQLPITLLCLHGNHEMRPETIDSYHAESFCGGEVYVEDEFPNIKFAKDGQIYTLNGKRYLAIGGAYSVDKFYRLIMGRKWFSDEQPSEEVKSEVEKVLCNNNWTIDGILSHTCPLKYEPTEVFLPGIDQSTVDKTTEEWLDKIENKLEYSKWYCGHYHTDKTIDKMRFLYHIIEEIL